MQVSRVSTREELTALRDAWNALAGEVPFCGWDWLEAWWRHYQAAGDELCVLRVEDAEGALVGLAPWYCANSPLRGRVLRWLGSGEVATDYVRILARPGREADVADSIAAWLSKSAAGEWDALDLAGVDADDRCGQALMAAFRHRGHTVATRPGPTCWIAELGPDWESYLARLSSRRRGRFRQFARRLDAGAAVLHVAADAAQLARGFDILSELHQLRRRSLGQRGCFASERFANFHREVTQRLLESGRLQLFWIEIDGRPAVVHYSLAAGGTGYLYQCGFDPAFENMQVGWMGHAAGLRLALESGCGQFDFLRGDEEYKAQLAARPRPSLDVQIVARRRVAEVRHRAWQAATATNRWARRCAKRGLQTAGAWFARPAAGSTAPKPPATTGIPDKAAADRAPGAANQAVDSSPVTQDA